MISFGMLGAAASGALAADSGHIATGALVAAARQATLKDIDYDQHQCDGTTGVMQWLTVLTAEQARSIIWSGGQCRLTGGSGIDVKDWPYCAQASITLVHPKAPGDTPEIEIYFEQPVHGKPGVAYAFRSVMMDRSDGPDYERFRKDFEAEWRERFPDTAAPACED